MYCDVITQDISLSMLVAVYNTEWPLGNTVLGHELIYMVGMGIYMGTTKEVGWILLSTSDN